MLCRDRAAFDGLWRSKCYSLLHGRWAVCTGQLASCWPFSTSASSTRAYLRRADLGDCGPQLCRSSDNGSACRRILCPQFHFNRKSPQSVSRYMFLMLSHRRVETIIMWYDQNTVWDKSSEEWRSVSLKILQTLYKDFLEWKIEDLHKCILCLFHAPIL